LLPGEHLVKIDGTGNTSWIYTIDGIEKIKVEPKIRVGSRVTPVTPAGLCLSPMASTGKYLQGDYSTTCAFKGIGTVMDIRPIIIDYDSWPDDYVGLGKLEYINCLVQSKDGIGWAGAGALRKVEDNEDIQKGFASTKPCRRSARSNQVRRRALERRSRARNHHWK